MVTISPIARKPGCEQGPIRGGPRSPPVRATASTRKRPGDPLAFVACHHPRAVRYDPPVRREGGPMSSNSENSAELVGRLERLPFSRWHRNFFLLAFLGVMFDAADFALFGAALPPIAKEFGLGPAQAGLLATVGLVGAFLGALFWGTISDYIGRRTAFAATIGIFSLFTGLVAASWNVLSLAVFRFISNFGLGGEVPVALTLTSEYSPSRIRGRMTGSMMAAFPTGLALAALVSLWLIPAYGWRAIFIAGMIPAVLLFFVRIYMPESVRYLITRGRIEEAERTVAEI